MKVLEGENGAQAVGWGDVRVCKRMLARAGDEGLVCEEGGDAIKVGVMGGEFSGIKEGGEVATGDVEDDVSVLEAHGVRKLRECGRMWWCACERRMMTDVG